MASRRDQLQSYQFRNQRVISAFVMRETDPAQSPLRRGIGALFGGLMIAILVAAGFGIYGVLTRTGSDRWKADGSVVVERESGASFVYLRDRLNPALNFTSAKLAAGRPNPQVFRVSAKELAGTPRGVPIGIAGAPASLPDPGRQVRLPWTMCTVPGTDDARTVLLIASGGPAGAALGDRGLLVTDAAAGSVHLVWQGRKHQVRNARVTVPALFGAVRPARAGTAWLNALPSGADISPIDVDDRGDPSAAVPGRDNGEVLLTETGSGKQFYLVLDDGLAPITGLQQAVLQAAFPGEPDQVAVNEVIAAPESDALAGRDAATQGPSTVPPLAPAGEAVCAVTGSAADPPAVSVGASAAGFADAVPTPGATDAGRPLADAIAVPAGRFELVRAAGNLLLITDTAVRHALPSPDAASFLGYDAAGAIDVPTALVNAIPAGVTLDPAAALRPTPPTVE